MRAMCMRVCVSVYVCVYVCVCVVRQPPIGWRVRDYADDVVMVAWGDGPEAVRSVSAGWEVVRRFGESVGIRLNAVKSVRSANCPAVRRALEGEAGPPVQRAGAGGADRAATPELRLIRCGRLPLPWWRNARFIAAARVPAVLYRSAQTPAPALRRLRGLFCRALIRARALLR